MFDTVFMVILLNYSKFQDQFEKLPCEFIGLLCLKEVQIFFEKTQLFLTFLQHFEDSVIEDYSTKNVILIKQTLNVIGYLKSHNLKVKKLLEITLTIKNASISTNWLRECAEDFKISLERFQNLKDEFNHNGGSLNNLDLLAISEISQL